MGEESSASLTISRRARASGRELDAGGEWLCRSKGQEIITLSESLVGIYPKIEGAAPPWLFGIIPFSVKRGAHQRKWWALLFEYRHDN